MGLSVLLAKGILKLLLFLCLIIREVKSPYDVNNKHDMELRLLVTNVSIKEEGHIAQIVDVGREFISCVGLWMVHFMKYIFDLLLLRAQMISLNLASSDVRIDELLAYF